MFTDPDFRYIILRVPREARRHVSRDRPTDCVISLFGRLGSNRRVGSRSECDTMSAPVSTMKKFCFKCGKEVSGGPRVKDEEGRYYCVPCAQELEMQRMHVQGGICEGCGESFSKSQLMLIAGKQLCPRCRKTKFMDTTGAREARRHFFNTIKSWFGR